MENLSTEKLKTFWQKPEGKVGKWVLLGLVAVAGIAVFKFLDVILPVIVRVLQNGILATIYGLVLVALIFILSNKKVHALISFMFQSLMRFITGIFIQIDPIGIMMSYVEGLAKKQRNIDDQITRLKGIMRSLREKIDENKQIRDHSMGLAQEAKKRIAAGKDVPQMKTVLMLYSRKAGRRLTMNVTYEKIVQKMDFLYRVLQKMKAATQYYIEDISDEVESLSQKKKSMDAAYSGFKSTMGVIKDGSEKRAIFDQTVEFIKDDYGQKLGQIDSFMELSEGFLTAVDLEKGMMEEEALKELEEWESKADDLILGDEKPVLVAESKDEENIIDLDSDSASTVPESARRTASKDGKYKRLLNGLP